MLRIWTIQAHFSIPWDSVCPSRLSQYTDNGSFDPMWRRLQPAGSRFFSTFFWRAAAESRCNDQFPPSFQCVKSDSNHLCDILELSGASFVTHLSEESPKMRHNSPDNLPECSKMGLGLFRNFTFACPPPGPAIRPHLLKSG